MNPGRTEVPMAPGLSALLNQGICLLASGTMRSMLRGAGLAPSGTAHVKGRGCLLRGRNWAMRGIVFNREMRGIMFKRNVGVREIVTYT